MAPSSSAKGAAVNDFNHIRNKGFSNATTGDWIKLGISTGSLIIKSNPVLMAISLAYGVADLAGYNPVDLCYGTNKKK